MGEDEGKIEQLNNRMSLINKTEKRLNDLSIMAEDVKIRIKALSDEDRVITRAGEQIAELRFLLSEVERKIGVIGGSGLYDMPDLKNVKSVKVKTPFGDPSDNYILGTLNNREMVFLPRHGKGHRIQPTELNFRANIYGMKKLGVEWIISVSAVGSMKEEIAPGNIV